MLRAGVSLPALMRLMGHSDIQTMLLHVQVTPQDVYLEYARAVASLGAALNPETIRHYRGTVRSFLTYLGATYPRVNTLKQLRRDPHILGWMSRRRSQTPYADDKLLYQPVDCAALDIPLNWRG
jgi:hypothetical protein